jgi:hypothetical protein
VTAHQEPEYVSWSIKELATPYYGKVQEDKAKALTLPKYQRNFVWKDSKRKELVDSIRRGFPIGTLIVRRIEQTTEIERIDGHVIQAETFEVLDGLQRSTTLLLHRLNFLELIDEADVEAALKDLGVNSTSVQEDLGRGHEGAGWFSSVTAEWMRSCTKSQTFKHGTEKQTSFTVQVFDKDKFQTLRLLNYLAKSISSTPAAVHEVLETSGHLEQLSKLTALVEERFDIRNKKIPVIIWSGPDAGAAQIFERVNQGGVRLNRYQSLAASWYNTTTDIMSNTEIGKKAQEALSTKVAGAIVEKHLRGSEKLDLYEALIGLSEKLAADYPYLFPPANKPDKQDGEKSPLEKQGINYYAFNIAALTLGKKISELGSLSESLDSYGEDKTLKVKALFEAVLSASKKVNEALIRLSYANNEYNVGHSEAAMSAMVSALASYVLRGKSINTISERALRHHYLFDLIAGLDVKGHASDLAAFERVWRSEGADLEPNAHYLTPMPSEMLSSALDAFWEKEKTKTVFTGQKQRPRIDSVQKTVLRLYLGHQGIHEVIAASDSHHVDHVIPFTLAVKNWLPKDKDGVFYIGAITNLAFLPAKLNLSKGALTLDQWLDAKLDAREKPTRDMILNKYTKAQIWSLVAALPGESKEVDKPMNGKSTSVEFNEMQTKVWQRMKSVLLEN